MNISQRDRAYQYIRGHLVSGRFAPGARLSHRALAKEIGMSFIPVREAVSQLVSEGLVSHEPKLGTFVTEISRQELAELYDLREALERHAAGKAAERISQAELADMQHHNGLMRQILAELQASEGRSWDAPTSDAWMIADAAFHMTLLRAAGNRRLIKTVGDLRVMTHVFGHRGADRELAELARTVDEHQKLIDALAGHDANAAASVLVRHIRSGCELAMKNFDRRRLEDAAIESASAPFAHDLRQQIQQIETDGAA